MQFTETDLDTMLAATGEPVVISIAGVPVRTIQAKFRKDYLSVSPFETSAGVLQPAITCKTSDLADITGSYTFLAREVEYKLDGKPEDKPSGLTVVRLGKKV